MPDYRHLLAMTDENGLLQFSIKTNPDCFLIILKKLNKPTNPGVIFC